MLSGQDEMRWNGSFLHSWWLSARWFACGCFIWPPSIMSRAFYDLKRRCLATKNHPIWLIGLSSRELKHLLTLGKRQDLGVYQCTNPIWHQLYFPLSLRFQPTPGYKEDATTQRFFSAGLTEESVSFGSLQVSQWDEWAIWKGKNLQGSWGRKLTIVLHHLTGMILQVANRGSLFGPLCQFFGS